MKKKLIIYLILLSSINILLLSSCSNHQPHTHKFNEEKIIKEASCTTDGIKEYKCSCDQTKEEKIRDTEIMIDDTQRYLDETMLKASISKTKINKL